MIQSNNFIIGVLLIPFLIFIKLYSFSQTKEQVKNDIDSISSIEEARIYSDKHPTWLAHIYTISELDTTKRFEKILEAPLMKTFHWYDNSRNMNFMAKVLDTLSHNVWDGEYFYIDHKGIEEAVIDSLITVVFQKHRNGEKFDSLVKDYHTGNPYNKLQNVKDKDLIPVLDEKTKDLKVGELITTFDSKLNLQFFVIKTIAKRPIRFRKVIVTNYKD